MMTFNHYDNGNRHHAPLPRDLVRREWTMPSFNFDHLLDVSHPACLDNEAWYRTLDEADRLWNEAALPLPSEEVAYIMLDKHVAVVLHTRANRVENSITVVPYELHPGAPWETRLRLTLHPGKPNFDVAVWLGVMTANDQGYAHNIVTGIRMMTYLLARAPQDAITRTAETSVTLRALSRKLPLASQLPPTTTITVDVGRLARPQTASVPTGRVKKAAHNRKGHLRTIKRRDGTTDEVKVKPCKINGGGPVRDYE
jgi:hypothetical protein